MVISNSNKSRVLVSDMTAYLSFLQISELNFLINILTLDPLEACYAI